MSQNDPFSGLDSDEGDQTIIRNIRPTPGGQRRSGAPESGAPPRPSPPPVGPLSRGKGLNPLENSASDLLALIMRLKNTPSHTNIEGLRNQLIEGIKTFEAKARGQGVSEITVTRARYILCTVLDEFVASTPWGSGVWRNQTLLTIFHKERWGGEKVFLLLDSLIQDPATNIDLLELMHICLGFGYEGRYRVIADGRAQLEWERERVYRAIRNQRGDFERELSPHWRGLVDYRNPLIRYVPLWVILAVAALLLLGAYLLFSVLLNRVSDPVFLALSGLRGDAVAMVERDAPVEALVSAPPPPPPVADNFRKIQGIGVITDGDKVTLRIPGGSLFDTGKADVKPEFLPVLRRIAEDLKTAEGQVLVTGHTDNVPIRTLRFPSNFHLSKARAAAVAQILVASVGSSNRFVIEGRGEAEPIASNDTPQSRALNRRVDVILLTRTR